MLKFDSDVDALPATGCTDEHFLMLRCIQHHELLKARFAEDELSPTQRTGRVKHMEFTVILCHLRGTRQTDSVLAW